MSHILQNSPHVFRTLILYEAIDQLPAFHAYKNFARKVGEDAMSYQDFEFWYMRFLRGEYDMDYDRSQDPKCRSLMNMPLEIIERITSDLTKNQRITFRKVCRSFRIIMDMKPPAPLKKILVRFEADYSQLWLDDGTRRPDRYINWHGTPDEQAKREFDSYAICYMSKAYCWNQEDMQEGDCKVSRGYRGKILKNTNHWELAMNDLTTALKEQKAVLDEIMIENKSLDSFGELEPKLKALSGKVLVKKLKIVTNYSNEEAMILPYVSPEHIEEVEIEMRDRKFGQRSKGEKRKRIQKIVETELWKRAEIRTLHCHSKTAFPLDTLMDFTKFNLRLEHFNSSPNSLLRTVQNLITSPVLECVRLGSSSYPSHTNHAKLIAAIGATEINWMTHHVRIPNSQEFFEIKFDSNDKLSFFTITRINVQN
ncbi:hypothetical protein CRE_16016 [Caenorhabditis remanei]|uniref:F-box domain-containing protein n=1 Tax=Caenorhabditis remanei TaxID=31234 RepID=E3MBC5_CAERE|nr:hypothetical protein CRE_16016 [Caenorhabditis remanei]